MAGTQAGCVGFSHQEDVNDTDNLSRSASAAPAPRGASMRDMQQASEADMPQSVGAEKKGGSRTHMPRGVPLFILKCNFVARGFKQLHVIRIPCP